MEEKRIHVGTSGWTYRDWAGRFYPPEVKGADRLTYYAGHFDTVEVNATFYRLPNRAMIDAWNRRLEQDFHLVLKGSRVITHLKKIRDFEEPLEKFLDRAQKLERLNAVLWQLPPSLHKDLKRLEDFLCALPENLRHAVEFRHVSWWDEDVASLLAEHSAAFVAVSRPELPDTVYPTGDFLYLRFHGLGSDPHRHNYTEGELARWAEKVRGHLAERTLYAFFNNDHKAHAPQNAKLFKELLAS